MSKNISKLLCQNMKIMYSIKILKLIICVTHGVTDINKIAKKIIIYNKTIAISYDIFNKN